MKEQTKPELIVRAAKAAGFEAALSRRRFLILSACAVAGAAALNVYNVWGADAPLIIIDNAKGLVLTPTQPAAWAACAVNWPAPSITTAVPNPLWPGSR